MVNGIVYKWGECVKCCDELIGCNKKEVITAGIYGDG